MIIITCDQCGTDMTDAGKHPEHNIQVTQTRRATTSDTQYAIWVQPPLKRDRYDFCSRKCLLEHLGAKL